MDLDRQAAIIINDLDSLVHRIEALQTHPKYTEAIGAVLRAKQAIRAGRYSIHKGIAEARISEEGLT